jgi:hypothetical protein
MIRILVVLVLNASLTYDSEWFGGEASVFMEPGRDAGKSF